MSSINSGSIVLAGSPNVLITNFDIALANTEYEHVLQNNLTLLEFKVREDGVALQWCFTALESNTRYFTLPACSTQSFAGIKLVSKSMFVQADAQCTIEIIEFYS